MRNTQKFDQELTMISKRVFEDLLYALKAYGSRKTFFDDMEKIINSVDNIKDDLIWIWKVHIN